MKKFKVIDGGNLPTRIPIFSIATWFLIMERFSAPEWLWWVLSFFWVVVVIGAINRMSNQEKIKIFDDEEEPVKPKESKFKERLKEKQNEQKD